MIKLRLKIKDRTNIMIDRTLQCYDAKSTEAIIFLDVCSKQLWSKLLGLLHFGLYALSISATFNIRVGRYFQKLARMEPYERFYILELWVNFDHITQLLGMF